MSDKIRLWSEDVVEAGGNAIVAATLEVPGHERIPLFYRVPIEHRSSLSRGSEPFVLASLFTAMRESTDLVVHGAVSPSLLRNLEEFQGAWSSWKPDRYTRIEIVADLEREPPDAPASACASLAFSGGVDSAFTAFRHRRGLCGRQNQSLEAGIMVHGFDIPLSREEEFDRARGRSAEMLASLGMTLIPVATNLRELGQDWEDCFGAATASCLILLQGGYVAGLIGSSEPYQRLVLPWGSNPLTDRLLSSDGFSVIHDGAAFSRSQKVREIANWPEGIRYLRVCWQTREGDLNCGRCEKCIRTILNFRVMGLGLPECFEADVSDQQIGGLRKMNSPQIAEFDQILSLAEAASISEPWVAAVRACVQRNRLAASGRPGLWRRLGRRGRA